MSRTATTLEDAIEQAQEVVSEQEATINRIMTVLTAKHSGGALGENTLKLCEDLGVAGNDLSIANGFAKTFVDEASEHTWSGERTTADGTPIKDKVAYVERIKGMSLKVKQMVEDPMFDDVTKWAQSQLSAIFEDNTAILTSTTNTGRSFLRSSYVPIDITHKYLCFADMKSDETRTLRYLFSYYFHDFMQMTIAEFTTSWKRFSCIGNPRGAESRDGGLCVQFENMGMGTKVFMRNFNIFDLTAMGMDDITTVDGFAQRMGYSSINEMPTIEYTPQPIIIHSNYSSIVSKDATSTEIDTLALPDLELRSNEEVADEYIPRTGVLIRRVAEDGTTLPSPTTEQLTPQQAFYKVQFNGREEAVSEGLSAPFVAEIGYRNNQ